MNTSSLGFRTALCVVLALTSQLVAQTPGLVMLFKTRGAVQLSASSAVPFESALGVIASFSPAVTATTVVQLVGNGNVLSVPRIDPQVYILVQPFADEAAIDRAVPNGTYTLSVTGGGASSSTPLVISPSGNLQPVLFSNFDRLQAWPDRTVRFAWGPIPGASETDALSLKVNRLDGSVVYDSNSSGRVIPSSASYIDIPGLPVNEPLSATLTYVRLSLQLANNGNTVAATGHGVSVRVPFRIIPAGPVIVRQPRSQTISAGSTVVFSADITGYNLSYQWRKNGVPIESANEAILVVPRATSAEAGFYTLDAVNPGGRVTTDPVALTVDSNLLPSRITNLAIRSSAGGARTLIVGFAVGPSSLPGSKPILLRGLGPALSVFGVPAVLADPKLEVYSGSNRIFENDDWGGNSQVAAVCASVGAFALSSAVSKDAALYSPAIATGSYSALLIGSPNTTGVALAEIYDATPVAAYTQSTPRLINVSARTQVGTGADILIAGFAITGNSPKTVLIRAIGPGLAGFGVQGTLVDPKLELFSGTSKLNENDDWGGSVTLANLSRNAGAFALSALSRDATLIVTLSPGSYTAQVSGVNNTTGISLVEIYEVP